MYKIENVSFEPCVDAKFVQVEKMNYSQDGVQKFWEIAKVHDSVAILLFDEQRQEIILVKQFRPPLYVKDKNNAFSYELCAGLVDKNKSLEQIAIEEIEEECGYRVKAVEKITSFYTAVGFAGGQQHLYFALVDESMRVSEGGGIDSEMIEVIKLPLKQAKTFMFDESKPKTPGLLFAFEWLFQKYKH